MPTLAPRELLSSEIIVQLRVVAPRKGGGWIVTPAIGHSTVEDGLSLTESDTIRSMTFSIDDNLIAVVFVRRDATALDLSFQKTRWQRGRRQKQRATSLPEELKG